MWPAVLEALKSSSRVAHTLAEGSVPISRTSKALVIAHPEKVRMDILRGNKGHVEQLRIAILDVVRLDTEIDFTHNPEPASIVAKSAPPATSDSSPEATDQSSDDGPKKSARERIAEQVQDEVPVTEDVAAADDTDLDDSGLSGLALIQRELGGTIMTEYDND
jgi:DNA polymerase-3 subunit gamma/tau